MATVGPLAPQTEATPPGPPKVAHPWRRVLRTILAEIPAIAITIPLIINAMALTPDQQPWLWAAGAVVITVSAAITRILAIPQVEAWLRRSINFLAAEDIAADKAVPIEMVAAEVSPEGVLVAGMASAYADGSPVAVTPLPSNGPEIV